MVVRSAGAPSSFIAPSDEEVVQRVLAGERELFEVLMRRHNQRVYRAVRSILKIEAEVEDAMQEAYVSAFSHLSQFDGTAAFSTWLVRIAINEALMKLRKRNSERISDYKGPTDSDGDARFPEIEDTRQDPERRYMSKELARKAFRGLNPSLQDTFILQKAEGWTNRELAKELGITVSTVKSRIFRARVRLRQQLSALTSQSVALSN